MILERIIKTMEEKIYTIAIIVLLVIYLAIIFFGIKAKKL